MELERKILDMIVDALSLEDVDKDNFDYDVSIFASQDKEGKGLGLDSVDALELVVSLRANFGVKVTEQDMKTLQSVRSVADFVRANAGENEKE